MRDHDFVSRSEAGPCRGRHRDWAELGEVWEGAGVCRDCRQCFGCADLEGCSARRRPRKPGVAEVAAGEGGKDAGPSPSPVPKAEAA